MRDVLQRRRLALATCYHHRLGVHALLADADVVAEIGRLVVAQSLLTRDEAAIEMAAELRSRALRGETLLRGMVVRFARDGEGVYVGGKEDSEQGCYTFRFGTGATARTKRMRMAPHIKYFPGTKRPYEAWEMEPHQWSVSPCVGNVFRRSAHSDADGALDADEGIDDDRRCSNLSICHLYFVVPTIQTCFTFRT